MGVWNTLFGNPNSGLKKGADEISSGYDTASKGLDSDSAKAMGLAREGQANDRETLKQGTADSRMDMAKQFRQDANNYEQTRAAQGAMAAYGNDPLSGGTRGDVTSQLAQLARQNYGAALDRANNATNVNMQAGLQSNQNATGNLLGVQNNLTNQRLATQTGRADSLGSNYGARQDDGGIVGKVGNFISSIF